MKNEDFRHLFVLVLIALFVIGFYGDNLLCASEESYSELLESEPSTTYPEGWFYTLNEIGELYSKEYSQGKRLVNHIRPKNGVYIAPYNGEYVVVPKRFISLLINNIQTMVNNGLAKYVFRLDCFHGHPFVTDEKFEKTYKSLTLLEMTEEYAQDESLGVLFHNAEHLALRNPPITGTVDLEAWGLIRKRNVIGWHNGRPMEIIDLKDVEISSDKKSFTAGIPDGYRNVGSITFKATKNGEFQMKVDSKIIRLDISLYECFYH